MMDPISFVAGGATVVLGRIAYSSISASLREREIPPPPPPPPPSKVVRVRLLVGNMRSILCRSDEVYDGAGPSMTVGSDGAAVPPTIDRASSAADADLGANVTLKDILGVNLKKSPSRPSAAAIGINDGPACATLTLPKNSLRPGKKD